MGRPARERGRALSAAPPTTARRTLAALGRLRLGAGDELIVADNTRGRHALRPRRRRGPRGRGARPPLGLSRSQRGRRRRLRDLAAVHRRRLRSRARPPRPPLGSRARARTRRGRRRGARRRGAGGVPRPLVAVAARADRLPSAHARSASGRDDARTCSCAATRSRPSAVSARCARTRTSSSAGASRSAACRSSTGPGAIVAHRDPEDVVAVVRQAAGYGAGRRWLRSSYGPAVPEPTLVRPLARAAAGRSPGRSRCGSSARRSSSSTASSRRRPGSATGSATTGA